MTRCTRYESNQTTFLEEQPNDTSHVLRVKSDNGDELCIPFGLRGATSYFPACKPTPSELARCRRFNLTSEEPEWDPSSTAFQEQEDATVDAHGMVHDTGDANNRRFISNTIFAIRSAPPCSLASTPACMTTTC
jgi:hypothetical protein